jgi:hypothetical protein
VRGRHNHHQRQNHWAAMRARYLRRQHRYYRSGKKRRRRRFTDPPPVGRTPHWIMAGWPHVTPRLRVYSHVMRAWSQFVHFPPLVVHHGGGGHRTPPWWRAIPSLRQPAPHSGGNLRFGLIGKQRRRVLVRGRKLGRLHGDAWKSAAAFRYWQAMHQAGWPAWDPDHRLPVFP